MKKILAVTFLIVLTSLNINAQCFEIETILVDGCDGGNEGQNEMVTFRVGAVALNTANLIVNWPNGSNPWLGICQNAGTAAKVAAINSSITACGLLVEPIGGVLPANSKILMITSENMNPSAQSFANLSETLTIIFQCVGNTSGHFANFGVGTRTLTMNFTSPPTCSDVVIYDRAQLLNQSQLPGAQDGGAVLFNAVGTQTYINNGCSVPVIPLNIITTMPNSACIGLPLSITSTVSGGIYDNIIWSGGFGTFASTLTAGTNNTYTPGSGDVGVITLSAQATRTCAGGGQTANTTLTFVINQTPNVISSATNITICPTQTAVLSVSVTNVANTGTINTSWSTGAINVATIAVTTGGNYLAATTGQCGAAIFNNFSVTVSSGATINSSASTNTLCGGSSVTLTANSSTGTYTWNTGSNNAAIVVSPTVTTTYTVNSANTCTSVNSIQTITVTSVPNINLNNSTFNICGAQSANIVATQIAGATYLWNPTGATTNSITTSAAGVYTVTASNSCGNSIQTATVITGAAPSFSINASSLLLCPTQQATLTPAGSAGSFTWSTGELTNAIVVNNAGIYTASLSNSCGNAIYSVTLTQQSLANLSPITTATLLCAGQTASLSAGAVPLTYSLTWVGPGIVGPSNLNNATINTGGTYTLIASDAITGCSTQTVITVTNGNTNANFVPNVNSGPAPLSVNFTNQSTGANTYSWVLGNGSSQTTTNTSSSYNTPGNYVVTLFASINGNCTTQYSIDIKVTEGLGIIPEIVTANGDNLNDFFTIKGLDNYLLNELQIFNRWGNMVYSSKPYVNDWNGKPNAQGKTGSNKLPSGTYYYILQLNDVNLTTFKGFVQLEY